MSGMGDVSRTRQRPVIMNHRLAPLIVFLVLGANSLPAAAPETEEALRKAAQRIHARPILVDGHNDITGAMTDAGHVNA